MESTVFSTRPEKQAIISEIDAVLSDTDFVFLLNYTGLSVTSFAALRREMRASEAKVQVMKNSFLAKVIEVKGWEGLDDLLSGQTAIVTGNGDPAEVAKKLVDFLKKHERSYVKGARLDDAVLSGDEVKQLSQLPSKDVLRAMLLGTMMAPATGMVRVLAAPLTSVLYVLKAKADAADGDGTAA